MNRYFALGIIVGLVLGAIFIYPLKGMRENISSVSAFSLPDLANNFIVVDGDTKTIYHYQINLSSGHPIFVLRGVTNYQQDYINSVRGK